MNLTRKSADCPYCHDPMRPAVMACDVCGTEVRGRFRQTHFARLTAEDQEFLESYLMAGFSIKALAEESGLGYVAIRTRLDRLMDSYRKLMTNEKAKRAILDRLESGEITSPQAAEEMEKL